MTEARDRAPRVLVAIPAYNEAETIGLVVQQVRTAVPQFDLLVIDDGSTDRTREILVECGVNVATHFCNLGYGRALQTALEFARRARYDEVITFDADGQHRAEDLPRVHAAFVGGSYDLLIGSRFIDRRRYDTVSGTRRIGMWLFSTLILVVTGRRVYDTSSGLKVIGRRVFSVLTARPFVDFHAEALVYLVRSGYSVGEYPIAVAPRRHGESMYGTLSLLTYPLKMMFLVVVSAIDARRRTERVQ